MMKRMKTDVRYLEFLGIRFECGRLSNQQMEGGIIVKRLDQTCGADRSKKSPPNENDQYEPERSKRSILVRCQQVLRRYRTLG